MGLAQPDDVVSLLAHDHEVVRALFRGLEDARPEERAELFWDLMAQLVRHEVAEEVVVYPVVQREPGGSDISDACRAEEAKAERMLAHMEKLDPFSEEFVGAVKDLRAAVLAHATNEENEIFPRLLANEDAAYLLQLGQKFKGEKLAAPSHPHPHAPNSALANKVVGPVAAFIDRLRDEARQHTA
jgi:hemerythrin superfamily protein